MARGLAGSDESWSGKESTVIIGSAIAGSQQAVTAVAP